MEGLGLKAMPKISVIMLTYNREMFLRYMIECIIAQTFRDFEFIIVDNGSTDRSGLIADEYVIKDARIRVIHRECGNIGSGRNAGLDVATGEYIAFVDDDDRCEPDFLEFLYNLAVKNNADVSMCGATGRNIDEKCVYLPEDALIELFWRKRFNVQFPTKLIHRRLFEHARFSECAKYDDIELMPMIIAKTERIAYHGLSKYTFYRHDSNNSSWTTCHELLNAQTLKEYLQVYASRTMWLCEVFPGNKKYWKYFQWSFQISMVEKVSRYKIVDCYAQCDELVKELREHRDEFLSCPWMLELEKKWIAEYT